MSHRSKSASVSSAQPDLFSFDAGARGSVADTVPASRVRIEKPLLARRSPKTSAAEVSTASAVVKLQTPRRTSSETRVISLDDLPAYPELDVELVDRSIAALPATRIWFTYSAIKECFGVSRATVARKVKKGLVPGIRFRGTSVLEDGPVRRFDRTQLRWLLLALRSHP